MLTLTPTRPAAAPAEDPRAYAGPEYVEAAEGEVPQWAPTASVSQPAPQPRTTEVSPRTSPAERPVRPLRIYPALDAVITVGTVGSAAVLNLWVLPQLPDVMPGGGDDSQIRRGDRVALGRFNPAAATASDGLLITSVAAPLVYHLIEAALYSKGSHKARARGFGIRYGTDVLIYVQALAATVLVTDVLKSAVGRARPFTFLDPADVDSGDRDELIEAQTSPDAERSFPSGHASLAFAAASAGATLLTIDLLGRSRAAIAVTWVAGGAVASTTAALRVVAGKHFPSDVVAGALIGAGVGAVVPLAHWPRRTRSEQPHGRGRVESSWTLAPHGSPRYGGLVLTGRFR